MSNGKNQKENNHYRMPFMCHTFFPMPHTLIIKLSQNLKSMVENLQTEQKENGLLQSHKDLCLFLALTAY